MSSVAISYALRILNSNFCSGKCKFLGPSLGRVDGFHIYFIFDITVLLLMWIQESGGEEASGAILDLGRKSKVSICVALFLCISVFYFLFFDLGGLPSWIFY